jgi:serine/threonine protein kinase
MDESLNETVPGVPAPAPMVLKNRFVIQDRIGGGGMGIVYRAIDRNREAASDPQIYVAVKVIGEKIIGHSVAAIALERECTRTQRLNHHNILRVNDFDWDGDTCFLTMELLQGESFEELLRRHPSGLTPAVCFPLLSQLFAGLSYAHENGIVHSDLKPSNIFLTTDNVVKILDFGIAAPVLEPGGRETKYDPRRLGAVSMSYSCLEMFAGQPADPRDDVYSLGCIVYQMLAGIHPFRSDAFPAGADAISALKDGMVVIPLTSLTTHQNEALRRALAFRREDRTASVKQFSAEFLDSQAAAPRGRAATASQPSRLGTWRIAVSILIGIGCAVAVAVKLIGPAKPSSIDPSRTAPVAGASTTVSAAAARLPTSQLPAGFKEQCGAAPDAAGLDQLIDRGLHAQTDLTLGDTPAVRDQAMEIVRHTADCLRKLRELGIDSRQSRDWLTDADTLLKKNR